VDTVLGYDAVGEIVELGPDVQHLKVGQKVTTFVRMGPSIFPIFPLVWAFLIWPVAPYGASQEYFLTQASCSWPFNSNLLTDDQAATIPLTLCTAGDAIYNKMRPPIPMPDEKPCGRPVLIWGAGSQVGMNAVQLAKKGGCKPVIATASPQVHSSPSEI
jgi:NADPH:quinone reductase-like Zn-dependent oxidoreductase